MMLMQAVREAVDIPVLANGNVRTLADVHACMDYTGAVGVMSAEALLEDPALFAPSRLTPEGARRPTEGCELLLEYLELTATHSTPFRMIRGHAFSMLGALIAIPSGCKALWVREATGCTLMLLEHFYPFCMMCFGCQKGVFVFWWACRSWEGGGGGQVETEPHVRFEPPLVS